MLLNKDTCPWTNKQINTVRPAFERDWISGIWPNQWGIKCTCLAFSIGRWNYELGLKSWIGILTACSMVSSPFYPAPWLANACWLWAVSQVQRSVARLCILAISFHLSKIISFFQSLLSSVQRSPVLLCFHEKGLSWWRPEVLILGAFTLLVIGLQPCSYCQVRTDRPQLRCHSYLKPCWSVGIGCLRRRRQAWALQCDFQSNCAACKAEQLAHKFGAHKAAWSSLWGTCASAVSSW